MSERVGTSVPAIDRLGQIFFPDGTRRGESLKTIHKLNDRENILVTYTFDESGRRALIVCDVERDSESVIAFAIREGGLEHLNLAKIILSSPGGEENGYFEPIEFRTYVGVDRQGLTTFGVEGKDWERYQALGDKLADWVEKVVRRGEIITLPFQLTSPV